MAGVLQGPVNGESGWELIRYEWSHQGLGTFHYEREGERIRVVRSQSRYLTERVNGR